MPYLDPRIRALLDAALPKAGEWIPDAPGELNYVFTKTLLDYLKEKGLSYQTINDIVGALEGAKAEFQRRVVAPYEDTKIQENGDVY